MRFQNRKLAETMVRTIGAMTAEDAENITNYVVVAVTADGKGLIITPDEHIACAVGILQGGIDTLRETDQRSHNADLN